MPNTAWTIWQPFGYTITLPHTSITHSLWLEYTGIQSHLRVPYCSAALGIRKSSWSSEILQPPSVSFLFKKSIPPKLDTLVLTWSEFLICRIVVGQEDPQNGEQRVFHKSHQTGTWPEEPCRTHREDLQNFLQPPRQSAASELWHQGRGRLE